MGIRRRTLLAVFWFASPRVCKVRLQPWSQVFALCPLRTVAVGLGVLVREDLPQTSVPLPLPDSTCSWPQCGPSPACSTPWGQRLKLNKTRLSRDWMPHLDRLGSGLPEPRYCALPHTPATGFLTGSLRWPLALAHPRGAVQAGDVADDTAPLVRGLQFAPASSWSSSGT